MSYYPSYRSRYQYRTRDQPASRLLSSTGSTATDYADIARIRTRLYLHSNQVGPATTTSQRTREEQRRIEEEFAAEVRFDLLLELCECGLEHVAEQILLLIDIKDVARAQQVSK
mgnify:CR=1 FL=1